MAIVKARYSQKIIRSLLRLGCRSSKKVTGEMLITLTIRRHDQNNVRKKFLSVFVVANPV
jgi:hypothetical protein